MTWRVTAEHERFDDAVSYFRSRVSYPRERFDALNDAPRARAFYVSGGFEIEAVQTIFTESPVPSRTASVLPFLLRMSEAGRLELHARLISNCATLVAHGLDALASFAPIPRFVAHERARRRGPR